MNAVKNKLLIIKLICFPKCSNLQKTCPLINKLAQVGKEHLSLPHYFFRKFQAEIDN